VSLRELEIKVSRERSATIPHLPVTKVMMAQGVGLCGQIWGTPLFRLWDILAPYGEKSEPSD